MQHSGSVGNPFAYGDRPQMGLDVEFGADPASGAFFQSDGRKHDDLKQMLDSNKDGLKLEAMKRIIGMIARGRDASDLFPAVVKNVVSKNIEVKKLVYVYLVRYAEEQQDLALLSISTFQRALKDPNQLIRASALRVLSSIRVSMIVPIVMLSIRDSASDMSAYVRKTAAHAIPKLYSLDPEQKDELVQVIEKLLSDRTTLVVGSAVMAFDEVCPERVDLIHKNYRKLCNLLVDVDEWGQVIIINMLTRYARTQFLDPNYDEPVVNDSDEAQRANNNQKFYDDSTDTASSVSSDESSENEDKEKSTKKKTKKTTSKASPNNDKQRTTTTSTSPVSPSNSSYHVDLDHRLLLRQTKPLLQSRNASVVMAVSQLYHHIAPRNEVQLIAKALIRLLRSHKEVQSVVLTCIASMSTKRKAIFEPYVKSFFVRTSDPTHIKLLKLDILTNLASASSISVILREFQTYISSSDRSFVAATIQAIGRCAASLKEVTETCLNGLVHLLSNHDEYVVAESVVVIKKLLQTKAAEHYEIISQMAKLLDFITVSAARASIIWLIGEYNEKVPKIAPDVLRKMAKTFADEDDSVKLQILNLGVKLYLTNPQQTSLLCQYVFTLARYDANYDIRDRARLLRQFIFPSNGQNTILSQNARKIFLCSKPAPALERKYRERDNFQLGSLSHYLNMRATGYKDLPPFPSEAPDSSVRNIEGFMHESTTISTPTTHQQQHHGNTNHKSGSKETKNNDKSFYAESEKSSDYSNSQSSSSSGSESGSDSDTESSSSSSSTAAKTSIAKQKEILEKKDNHEIVVAESAKLSKEAAKHKNVDESHSAANNSNDTGTSDSESSSNTSDSGSESGSESSKSSSDGTAKKPPVNSEAPSVAGGATEKKNLDLLLDLDDIPPIGPVMTPSMGGFLTPATPMTAGSGGMVGLIPQNAANRIELVGPSYIEFKHKEILNKLSGHGLQIGYRYTRAPHLYSATMVSVELQFVNKSNDDITDIQIGKKSLPAGMSINEFGQIPTLLPQQLTTGILGVDFNDTTHAIDFEITHSMGKVARITLKPPIGELIRSVQISEPYFKEQRTTLRGMNEHQCRLEHSPKDFTSLKQRIFESINVAAIVNAETMNATSSQQQICHFAGQTLSSKILVLITLEATDSTATPTLMLTVNCEKMVIGSMVLNELRNALTAL